MSGLVLSTSLLHLTSLVHTSISGVFTPSDQGHYPYSEKGVNDVRMSGVSEYDARDLP